MKTDDNNKVERIGENKEKAITAKEKGLKDDFFEQMSIINYLEQLSRIKAKLHEFNVNAKVSGFNELNSLAADILNICIHALQTESVYVSQNVREPKINILSLLELAVQLIPENLEILDELHQIHLKLEQSDKQ